MDNYKVIKYTHDFYNEWNDFIKNSKNGTFLFYRDFMDYHKDRFEDFSLLVFKKEKLVAVLPANKVGQKIYSHQGLTYGGLILPNSISFKNALEIIYNILKFLCDNNINTFIFKQLPKIYNKKHSDEMDYFLFMLNAKVFRKDVSMVVQLSNKLEYSSLRKRKLKLATKIGLKFLIETDMASFWNEILIPNLHKTYKVKPVHSLSEINKLRDQFPNNIKQYNVYFENELVAGCTIFETEKVAHIQYVSTKKEKNIGALDFLIDQLLTKVYNNKTCFDFGISNENEGRNINLGLLNWKQSFGASPLVHDFYEVETKNHQLLNGIFI